MMCVVSNRASSRWVAVARLGGLEGPGPHALTAAGVDLVAVRRDGRLRVFEGRCPHQGALLAEGELDGAHLVCRNHGWRFETASGQRDGGPQCLRACSSEPREGLLWVDVGELAVSAATASSGLRRIADLPGPPGVPLLGNALQLDPERLHLILDAWARAHGPAFRILLGRKPALCVSDPTLIEGMLRARPETFRRDARVEPIFAELGSAGVFSVLLALIYRNFEVERVTPAHAVAERMSLTVMPSLRVRLRPR